MDRQERLARLRLGFRAKHGDAELKPGQTKVGYGYNNLVMGDDLLESNQENPVNAGFSFSSDGSRLRTGRDLTTTCDFKGLIFNNGGERLNPLAAKASAVTDPLPTIVPNIPRQAFWLLDGRVAQVLDLLRAL